MRYSSYTSALLAAVGGLAAFLYALLSSSRTEFPSSLWMAQALPVLLQLVLGAFTGATALILVVVLYVTRSDALLSEETPTSLISKLEARLYEERFCHRVLDQLHSHSLVNGLQVEPAADDAGGTADTAGVSSDEPPKPLTKPAPAGAAGLSVAAEDDDVRLSLVRRVVPLLYQACAVHLPSTRVVSCAFAVLTAIAPLEEADTATNRALVRPDGLRILVKALRRHVTDARAARCGALSLGIAVNAACSAGPIGPDGIDPWPAAADLRDAADVCLLACEAHPQDRDVQLWSLYALLHMSAADDGDTSTAATAAGSAGLQPSSTAALATTNGLSGPGRVGGRGPGSALARSGPRGPIIIPIPGRPYPHPLSSNAAATATPATAVASGSAPPARPLATIGSRPYTLCGYMGERGAVDAVVAAMRTFPADERIASVAILLLGVLVKSRADNWALLLRSGAFEAVRHAVTTHKSSDKVMEVGTALLSVDAKFRAMAGEPLAPMPPAAAAQAGMGLGAVPAAALAAVSGVGGAGAPSSAPGAAPAAATAGKVGSASSAAAGRRASGQAGGDKKDKKGGK